MNSKFKILIGIMILTLSCDPDNVIETDSDAKNSITATEDAADYVWISNNEISITLSDSGIEESLDAVSVAGSVVTISKGGYYKISGTLTNGQIVVDADTALVKIKLNGATVTNKSGSPFYIKQSGKTILFLNENTANSFTDAASYSNSGEPNATIFSNSYLAFAGAGSLTVKANYNDGISSDDEVIINSGTFTVAAKDDAIRGKNYLKIDGGIITATATTGHALKSDNEDKAGYGYVVVNGGTLNLTSTSKDGIHAVKRVIVNGGTTSIAASKSQGLKSDSLVVVNGGTTTITASHEGVESPYIKVNDGNLYITATDDGFNASFGNGGESNDGSMLTLAGGYIYVSASTGDGLDSNGSITMTGGTVIVHGPSQQPEVAVDYNGTFSLSGGFLIATGSNSNMTQGASSSSSQCSLKITTNSSVSASTLFHIQDASGNDIATFKPARAYSSVIFSSSLLTKGSSYSIYTGGASTGTLKDGLYNGGTYSGGTLKKTFTISGSVTAVTF